MANLFRVPSIRRVKERERGSGAELVLIDWSLLPFGRANALVPGNPRRLGVSGFPPVPPSDPWSGLSSRFEAPGFGGGFLAPSLSRAERVELLASVGDSSSPVLVAARSFSFVMSG
ncbi:hypothetical protein NL676_017241 [Syzygium grande]|nr:hypothetical protein NL676_017241 [Syzygium grande]